ncbi:TATA element modulatory factor isoform X2 [Ambystoma mexicanum]|uniref:TATA element modulatory factor isoform X2 n=1 Tax=Ambystoma mexicanum TaxID=8296 RepID=UPI0037E7B1DB
MSWFNASHLSSFAKQALSQAQKSIDRVLDIQEDEHSWGDTILPTFEQGNGPSMGSWGTHSIEDSPTQPVSSPKAITKPVRRTVVDESENFFSAFLSPVDVQIISNSPVVSKPPSKSQRPKEDVTNTIPDLQDINQSETLREEKPTRNEPSLVQPHLIHSDEASDTSEPSSALFKIHDPCKGIIHEVSNEPSSSLSDEVLKTDEQVESGSGNNHLSGANNTQSPSLSSESKDNALVTKEEKHEDRQSNTPSPPVSTFSSGTSTTSDIEVLDHESVISESSASSRQETADSKASLHLMQTSFQLLSASACTEYSNLDDFQKLTESGCSSDAFERIDSFSVQSLDSRSVSEINSDDELSGRGGTSISTAVSPCAPKTDSNDSLGNKSDEELNETLVTQIVEETEMEESGRSATPVNTEQPDILVSPVETDGRQSVNRGIAEELQEVENERITVSSENEDIQRVIHELQEKLEKRETQLLTVSKEKAKLEEAYDNLKDEMFRVQEESSSIISLKEEFTNRIADAEKKVHLACKERDVAKKEVKAAKEELSTRLNSNETAELMKERDEQIKGLMEEGEKLSKQQHHNSNIIKKLRVKEKDNENTIAKQTKKIKELEEQLQQFKQVLDGKEEVEKQHRENIKKLNSLVERQEKDIVQHQADIEELQEKNRSLQAALDSSYRELAELHKANASKVSEAQEVALSCEIKAREEFSLALEKVQEEGRHQQEALAMQVTDLRLALQRAEQQAARKEDYLRHEIGELQQRLQEGENRNQDLSQTVTFATRPLLRQIENLQATLGAHTTSWEKLEKNLSDRLAEAQTLLAASVEKERAATEELIFFKTQLSSAESQISLLRQEKSRLQAQLEVEKAQLSKVEEEHSRYQVELENLKSEYNKACEDAKREKTLLSSQLEMEKMRVEQEKKKAILVQEAIKERERKPYPFSPMEPTPSTPSLSRSSSISGVDMAGLQSSFFSQEDPHEHSLGPMNMSASGSNLYEAVRMGAGSSIIENLQSQLKLREGEIVQLQRQGVPVEAGPGVGRSGNVRRHRGREEQRGFAKYQQ